MKIVCVGLNKTGTMSLHTAFEQLGFRSLHHAYYAAEMVEKAIHQNQPVLRYLQAYDCYADSPFHRYYFEIDMAYDDVRFILNTRSLESWLESRRKHDENWSKAHTHKPPRLFDADRFKRYYEAHHAAVRTYFKQSKSFIEFDVEAGDSWQKLCDFLGKPVPNVPFPHVNKAGELFKK